MTESFVPNRLRVTGVFTSGGIDLPVRFLVGIALDLK